MTGLPQGGLPINVKGNILNVPITAVVGGTASSLNEVNLTDKQATNAQRWSKALTSGLIEGTTEGLFGLFGVGGSTVEDKIEKSIVDKISSGAAKTFAKYGINSTEEAVEEFLSYAGNYIADRGIDKLTGSEFSKEWNWEEVGSQMGMAFLSTAISTAPGTIKSSIDTSNFSDNVISSIEENTNRNLTNEEKKDIRKQISAMLSGTEENDLSTEEVAQNFLYNSAQSENNEHTQQVILSEQQTAQNETSGQIQQNVQNMSNLMQTAVQYNKDTSDTSLKLVDEMLSKREIEGKFDGTLFDNENQNAIWRVIGINEDGTPQREVIFNPNSTSDKAFVEVAVHEMAHDLEGDTTYHKKLVNNLLKYAQDKEGYAEARKALEETYSKVYDINSRVFQQLIDEEFAADMLAKNLGNQEFINQLVTQDRSTMQKVWDWIKQKINSLRGNTNEAVYWQDIANKFEKAYNQKYQGTNEIVTKYSIQNYKGIGNVAQFDGIDYMSNPNVSIAKNIKSYFDINFKGKEINSINLDQGKKYAYPGYKQENYNNVKAPAVTIIDDIASLMNNPKHEADRKITKGGKTKKHAGFDTTGGFNHYNITIGIPNNNGQVEIYKADSITRIDKNGKEYFYDLDKIIDTGQKVVDNKSKPITDSSVSSTNIIPQNNGNINQKEKSNKSSFSMQEDDKGRKLTKEQQEFFKDSKIVDEKGNLKVVYHGTKNGNFTIFDSNKIGTGATSYASNGSGFYFTESKEIAQNYAGTVEGIKKTNKLLGLKDEKVTPKVYETYLNITNPFVVIDNKNNASNDILTEFSKKIQKNIENQYKTYNPNDYGRYKELTGADILSNVVQNKGKEFTKFLKSKGFDGIQYTGYNYDINEKVNNYIAFNSNQIKNVDNLKPTDNPDIRYSTENKTFEQWLKDNIPSKGTKGKTIKELNIAPIREDITNNNEKNKSFEDILDEIDFDDTEVIESPLKNRDINTIGNQKIKAYQYENPKVKPYFQEMAEMMGEDLSYVANSDNRSSIKGGGTKLSTNTNAIEQLHKDFGYSYDQIAKGLQNIIDDKGAENNAISKKIEFFIDDQLRNGYRNALGKYISPNEEYINTISSEIKAMRDKPVAPIRSDIQTKKNNNMAEKVNDNSELTIPIKEDRIPSQNNPIGDYTKTRKHYKSVIRSPYTTEQAKKVAKELLKMDTYIPDSNENQLERADERITKNSYGADGELQSLLSKATTGGKIDQTDIAIGERLIQYYSKTGEKNKLQDAIQATAMAGTTAGQTVQALSLLNHQTPEGQAIWIQRSVDKMNNEMKRRRGDKADQFNLTEDMVEKIVNSKDKTDLQKNVNEVYEQLGNQVSKTVWQKIDAFRYFSMLANPRTHLRNIAGNAAMGGTQIIKNKVAGAIEDIVSKVNPKMERTHTLKPASKEIKEFAKNDIKNIADTLGLNENKYNPKTRLENSMRTFKNETLENTIGRLFDLNDKALEAEDGWGLKAGYVRAMSEYMTANKLTPENITDKQLSKARKYAINQAQEATFHQASKVASALNQFSRQNGYTKFLSDALIPFKKTPVNIAKSGLEYSPVGLVKSLILDTTKLRKGDITINQYIDNISKGLTGSGITFLGYVLADIGILKASGGNDDKEKYDEQMGSQTYSIKIGDNTYTLDWLTPSGIPLFIGAEISQLAKSKSETKTSSTDEDSQYSQVLESGSNLLNGFASAMSPMAEMSMLSGLTSTLQSYEQGSSQIITSIFVGTGKSYINQFIPTLFGQLAKTLDTYERSTTSTKTDTLSKAIDQTKNQIMNKIPGLRQLLPIKTDIWGNEVKQSDKWYEKIIENGLAPWTRRTLTSSDVDNALNDLYDSIGESSIFPKKIEKNLTIEGQNYRLTNEEINTYQKKYGQTAYKLLDELVKSREYKNMNNIQKQKAIEEIYEYAKENNKIDYTKQMNKKIDTSITYKNFEKYNNEKISYLNFKVKSMENNIAIDEESYEKFKNSNISLDDYIDYHIKIKQETNKQKENGTLKVNEQLKDKDRIQITLDSNYSDDEKWAIYKNYINTKDSKTFVVDRLGMPIEQYLKYKQQKFENDKDENNETISGTKKQKVFNYLNNISNKSLSREYKMIIAKMEGISDYDREVVTFINNTKNITKQEKIDFLKDIGFKVDKNGYIQTQYFIPRTKNIN